MSRAEVLADVAEELGAVAVAEALRRDGLAFVESLVAARAEVIGHAMVEAARVLALVEYHRRPARDDCYWWDEGGHSKCSLVGGHRGDHMNLMFGITQSITQSRDEP